MAQQDHSEAQKANGTAPEAVPAMSETERRQVRVLLAVVIGLGVLLVAGLAVLVTAVIMRAGGGRAPAPAEMTLQLPAGAQVREMVLDGGVLALRVQGGDGRRVIVVVDARRGRVLRRIRLQP